MNPIQPGAIVRVKKVAAALRFGPRDPVVKPIDTWVYATFLGRRDDGVIAVEYKDGTRELLQGSSHLLD